MLSRLVSSSVVLFALIFFNSAQVLASLDCSRIAGSLPNPRVPAGQEDKNNPIRHILVIMQENHSFDNYFGRLNQPDYYGNEVDGLMPSFFNPDSHGKMVAVYPEKNLCVADPGHNWNAVHQDWDNGKLDGFVKTNDSLGTGSRVMGSYGPEDFPFYYALANQFAIGDRYFCSALTQTFPNRFYLVTGTSFGHIRNDYPLSTSQFGQKTVFDVLNQYGVSWRYYSDSLSYLRLFQPMYLGNLDKIKKIQDYYSDLASNTLPQVVFMDSSFEGQDEHPNSNVQVGQAWVAEQIKALINSKAWDSSVLFLTYDENGGFYDHVAPPEACIPDQIPPLLGDGSLPGRFDRYGFRVPFIAISPYAKHHFVSHRIYDHTSILKYIETKFNLPALTNRDANADGFSDLFDYSHPIKQVKQLPDAIVDPARKCEEQPNLRLPSHAALVQSEQSGYCIEVSDRTKEVYYSNCTGTHDQRFYISEDRFGTRRVRNLKSRLCLAVDWSKGILVQASCMDDEDQGFEIEAEEGGSVQFIAWHGNYCLSAGHLGGPVKVSECTNDGASDFILR